MQTVESMQVIQLLERLEGLGANPVALRHSAGLTPAQLCDPDERLPWEAFVRIVAAAEHLTGDPLIGLRAGLSRPPRGLLVYQFRAQPTLKVALAQFSQSARLATDPIRLEVREGTRAAWLCFALDDPESEAVLGPLEYLAGILIRLLQEGAPAFAPRELRFSHAPRAPLAEYQRLLDAPLRFRQSDCAVGIAPDLLAAPLESANPLVACMLDEQIERRLAVQRAGAFRASVERTMEKLLHDGGVVAREPVARRLAVSVRTLQRRLGAEAVTFHDVRDTVLQHVATTFLARPELSIRDVAQRTGFADEDAFAKAWKRWTGQTPGAFRRQLGPRNSDRP